MVNEQSHNDLFIEILHCSNITQTDVSRNCQRHFMVLVESIKNIACSCRITYTSHKNLFSNGSGQLEQVESVRRSIVIFENRQEIRFPFDCSSEPQYLYFADYFLGSVFYSLSFQKSNSHFKVSLSKPTPVKQTEMTG